jgi:glycerophosphoryl diester phosphodiesterase
MAIAPAGTPVLTPSGSTTVTSVAVGLPSVAVGDMIMLAVSANTAASAGDPAPTVAGFTPVPNGSSGKTGTPYHRASLFYRFKQTGDAATATVSVASASNIEALAVGYSGVDPVTPFVAGEVLAQPQATSSTAWSTGSITTAAARWIIALFANRTNGTWSGLTDTLRGTGITASAANLAYEDSNGLVAGGVVASRAATFSVATSVGNTVIVALNPAGVVTPPPVTLLSTWLAALPLYVAHRGGSTDYVEMTREAYRQAIAYGATAINIDAVRCASGEFVASHDTTTGRVFGTDLGIGNSTWTQLSGLRTTVGGFPIEKVSDLLAAYPNIVVFVENKGSSGDDAALLDMLDANGGKDRIVIKQYYTAATVSIDSKARGYTTWGYYYAADVANLATTHTRWDLLGLDYLDTDASHWTAIKSYGKKVLGHVIPSVSGASQAFSLGADGIMTGKIIGVVPHTDPPPPAVTLVGQIVLLGQRLGADIKAIKAAMNRVPVQPAAPALPAPGSLWYDDDDPGPTSTVWQSYTPVLTAGNSATTLGNGTAVGKYIEGPDKTIDFMIVYTLGSSTAWPAGGLVLTLPVATDGLPYAFDGELVDASAGGSMRVHTSIGPTPTTTMYLICAPVTAGAYERQVTFAVPWTWAVGDRIYISGRYRRA